MVISRGTGGAADGLCAKSRAGARAGTRTRGSVSEWWSLPAVPSHGAHGGYPPGAPSGDVGHDLPASLVADPQV